ncbi:MAG: porin [Myxococcaceae bacterium]|nr:porin [Myxococcaceae bacterium]
MVILLTASLTSLAAAPVAMLDDRVVIDPGRGITVRTLDGSYAATVRARTQIRNGYVHDAGDTNELNVSRLRFFFQGNALAPDLKYLVQLAFGAADFEAGNASPVYDAFVELTRWRDLNLRVGQFFVPFDRARTIRESGLQFVDRQIAVRELTLDRDVGLMVSSQDLFGLDGRLSYAFFVGAGDGKNRLGAQMAGPLWVLRLALRPMGRFDDDLEGDVTRDPKPRLALGVAGAWNIHTTRAQSTFGNTYTLGTADYVHGAVDVVFKWAGFSLLVEGVVRQALTGTLTGTSPTGQTLYEYTRSGWGYFVQAGYLVSQYVELTARWDQLYALPGTDPTLVTLAATQGRQLGGGMNVYVVGHILKLQADYFYIWGHAPGASRHSARVALDASF